MNFLKSELKALDQLLPGLAEQLRATRFQEMERAGNPALRFFREAGGPGLLIPKAFDGRGATPLEAARVHRALGFLSPSLSIAATMHNFSVASLVEMAQDTSSLAPALLEQIAGGNLYAASGVAEGRPGASALTSEVQVRRNSAGLILSGSKKPCSLSASMDILTASLRIPAGGPHEGELAFAVIPAQSPGIERRPFWKCLALAGAESEEIVLNNVEVADAQICCLDSDGLLLANGFLWFELLISASYLGIADGLLVQVFTKHKGSEADRALLGIEHEAAMAGLEGVARELPEASVNMLPRALSVRYAVQRTIERTSSLAAELLGGLAFLSMEEGAMRYAATRMLAFHPPSRLANAAALNQFLMGGSFVLQ